MKLWSTLFLLLVVLCSSCVSAYYLSPFNANSQFHHAVPLKSDSIKAATYASGNISFGSANDQQRDNVFLFNTMLHRSHTFGAFNAYYGGDFSLGNYKVRRYTGEALAGGLDTNVINRSAGNKFFGGYGFDGGMSVVIPFAKGGEWRVMGIETSVRKEFGNYLRFRNGLSPLAANVIDKNNIVATLGVSSDIVFRIYPASSVGIKLSFGHSIFTRYSNWTGSDVIGGYSSEYGDPRGYSYFSQTTHFTINKCTGFLQFNAGTRTLSIQMGGGYRLGK